MSANPFTSMRRPASVAIAALTLLCSAWTHAEWRLDNDASKLSFVSIKATNVAEVHHFTQLDGRIDPDGSAQINIALASVETNIPIRNERMQSMLFESEFFPTATISVPFEPQMLDQLAPGDSSTADLTATLKVRDRTTTIGVSISAVRLSADTIMVVNSAPIILNAESLGLDAGLEKLREVAGLPSISNAVPVSFVLSFTQSEPNETL